MATSDTLTRYLFSELNVRCVAVKLDESWQQSQAHTQQPANVGELVGKAVAITTLMASNLKAGGRISLQVQGENTLDLLLCQCRNNLGFRGLCNISAEPDTTAEGLEKALADSQISVLYEPGSGADRYQGIVPASSDGLAASLEGYFEQSEQLPTRIWVAANAKTAAGFMLQVLPGKDKAEDEDGWNRIQQLAETIKPEELLELDSDTVMHRLFNQESLEKLDERTTAFQCGCSQERVQTLVRGLGKEDAEALIEEQGDISVTCEFCNHQYKIDSVDLEALFSPENPVNGPETLQ